MMRSALFNGLKGSRHAPVVKSIAWLSHGCHMVVENYGITASAVNSGNIDAYVVAVDKSILVACGTTKSIGNKKNGIDGVRTAVSERLQVRLCFNFTK